VPSLREESSHNQQIQKVGSFGARRQEKLNGMSRNGHRNQDQKQKDDGAQNEY